MLYSVLAELLVIICHDQLRYLNKLIVMVNHVATYYSFPGTVCKCVFPLVHYWAM